MQDETDDDGEAEEQRAVEEVALRELRRETLWQQVHKQGAPAVMPNSARDTATKAKWYHIVTLKMWVRRIS